MHNLVQEAVTKTTQKEKKCKKAKLLCKEALYIAEKRKKSKKQGQKGKIYPTECRVPENRRDKNSEQCKEVEENFSRKLEISREHFTQE